MYIYIYIYICEKGWLTSFFFFNKFLANTFLRASVNASLV